MRVLITGATGLLGSRMLQEFPEEWEPVGTTIAPQHGFVEFQLEDRHSVHRVGGGAYDWIVHCAAIASPADCADDPRRAMEVNAKATGWLARAAADAGSRMAYASSHHVFCGDSPPYKETDPPSPVNVYGHTKLAGERHALSVPGALIVRLPALYSLDTAAPNNRLGLLRRSLEAGETFRAENASVRYFTLAEDVAAAFAFLIAEDHRGVYHVSAATGCTQFQFMRAAAEAMGLDPELVVEDDADPPVERPRDSRLDTGLYRSLGGPEPRPYQDALEGLRRRTRR